MFDKFKRASEEPADLDLIPVMNLFMVLIPFLLFGAAFVKYGVIPTSTPTKSDSSKAADEKDEDEPKRVMANLVVSPDELRISYQSSQIPDEELEKLKKRWAASSDGFPLDEMQKALKKVKKKYPESNTVTVLPHEEMQYQQLVEVLDHTREYEAGEKKDGSPKMEPLFPVTVFSKFIPPEESESGGEGGGE